MAKGETDDGVATARTEFPCWGMTLRDWFAGQALNGWMAHNNDAEWPGHRARVSEICYGYADAMLEARKR